MLLTKASKFVTEQTIVWGRKIIKWLKRNIKHNHKFYDTTQICNIIIQKDGDKIGIVKTSIEHPDVEVSNGLFSYDYRILELEEPMHFGGTVKSAEIGMKKDFDEVRKNGDCVIGE